MSERIPYWNNIKTQNYVNKGIRIRRGICAANAVRRNSVMACLHCYCFNIPLAYKRRQFADVPLISEWFIIPEKMASKFFATLS